MTPAVAFHDDVWVVVWDGVYKPSDDTFLLCQHLDISPGERMLEIGCGCGLVSIVAAKRGATVVATDISPLAVQNTLENVERHGLQDRIDVRLGYLFEPIRPEEQFTLIAFNPPYLPVTREDEAFDQAWAGGPDGRRVTDAFLGQCTNFLERKGRILLVQSSLSDPEKTQRTLEELFHQVKVLEERRFFFERLLLFEAKVLRRQLD